MALNVSPEEIQIINFHPGLICNETWKAMGLAPDFFDNGEITFLFQHSLLLCYLTYADKVYFPWLRSALW